MPLMPEGARLLVIRSADGTVLYEGDGQVQVGFDPAALPVVPADEPRQEWTFSMEADEEAQQRWNDALRRMVAARAEEHARSLSSAMERIMAAFGLGPEILTPPVRAEEYWNEIVRTAQRVSEPDIEELQRVADISAAFQDVRRLYESGVVRAEIALEEFQRAVTEPVPEYDELIASARAEFPYDPLDYGVFGREEMSWTPPEEGQEVPRCP